MQLKRRQKGYRTAHRADECFLGIGKVKGFNGQRLKDSDVIQIPNGFPRPGVLDCPKIQRELPALQKILGIFRAKQMIWGFIRREKMLVWTFGNGCSHKERGSRHRFSFAVIGVQVSHCARCRSSSENFVFLIGFSVVICICMKRAYAGLASVISKLA